MKAKLKIDFELDKDVEALDWNIAMASQLEKLLGNFGYFSQKKIVENEKIEIEAIENTQAPSSVSPPLFFKQKDTFKLGKEE